MCATLARAFPMGLRAALTAALQDLPHSEYGPSPRSITASNSREWPPITVLGEPVEIPHRIYNPIPATSVAPEGSHVATAFACIYTRHHDGFIRQDALRRILPSQEPWAIPFIVQLLGEYVIEICEDILRYVQTDLPHHPLMTRELRSFAAENPDFLVLTEQRATSYWESYYRGPHLYRDTYPGLRALRLMFAG